MLCPVCKNCSLRAQEIDPGLTSSHCPDCGGRWIASYQYWKWREKTGKSLAEKPTEAGIKPPVKDSAAAKLCPECGHFLRRFPVGHGIEFTLDRCGNCGGTWFDANEWETLKSRNLHDDVHKIFSEIWQKQIRDEAHQATMETFYRQKFGDDGYQKAKSMKAWIQSHPHQAELRAFLGF